LSKFVPISGKRQVFLSEKSVSTEKKAVFEKFCDGKNCSAPPPFRKKKIDYKNLRWCTYKTLEI